MKKFKLLTAEIISSYVSDVNSESIEYAIGRVVNQDIDYLCSLSIVDVDNIVTMKLLTKTSVNQDNWSLSPTVQFSYKLNEDGYIDVIVYKGTKRFTKYIKIWSKQLV